MPTAMPARRILIVEDEPIVAINRQWASFWN